MNLDDVRGFLPTCNGFGVFRGEVSVNDNSIWRCQIIFPTIPMIVYN